MHLPPELIRVIIYNISPDSSGDKVAKENPYIKPRIYELLLAACRHSQETGEIRNDELANQLIEYLVAATTGITMYWISLKKSFDIDTFQHKTIYLLLATNKSDQPASNSQ